MRELQIVSAAGRLVTSESGGTTSRDVASRAVDAFEQLVRHLSRLLGETGTRTILERSVHLASGSLPWLVSARTSAGRDGAAAALHTCFESQSPAAATEGFVLILSTFVGLLGRLIGEGLVTRVLHQLWPSVFPEGTKEAT
jgi:hypothetical protein